MLNYHNTDELKGKVSSFILDKYDDDFQNFILASIVAGFHRAYGMRNEGISMSFEIVSSINDDTPNLWERNILVWNLYILSRECIDDGDYEEALEFIERAENNWSRDVILGDEIGVYHVSWIEQIWLRKAEVFLLTQDIPSFESITDKILLSRFDFFKKANEITNETVIRDRCTYNCFELMSFERRRNDISSAVSMIKQAIIHKGGDFQNILSSGITPEVKKGNLYKAYDLCLKYFYSLSDSPYDSIIYGYCSTCKDYNRKDLCLRFNITTNEYKSCSFYENYANQ